ncbi:MAG: toll/interleukin-1 receptor domain-containing protein [Halobacteriota archaeon]|nr:toll/interleukin-1 receptor domain-containing protein [Halobacteriota archaeon]
MNSKPDHLFISYATEDWALAEWLTLHLTAEGYLVWCDRFKLLGGESYPKDIDHAITNSTFKFISLLSRNSFEKENPLKERTLALNLARERKEDFVIPIKVDDIKPTELGWMMSDLTYIDFHKNWAFGYKQLLKKLESVSAPNLLEDGMSVASQVFLDSNVFKDEPETVHSNCLQVIQIPKKIQKYHIGATTTWFALLELSKRWAIYPKSTNEVFAFHEPLDEYRNNFKISYTSTYDIDPNEEIEGIETVNIVKSLLKRSLNAKFVQKGLQTYKKQTYFPFGLLENDKIHFKTYTGKNTTVLVAGKRKWFKSGQTSEFYHYHIAPRFLIKESPFGDFIVVLTVGLFLTDTDGKPIQKRTAFARSRNIRKKWYNHEWFSRYLGIISFISDGQDTIKIGEDGEQQIIVSSIFINGTAPVSVLDEEEVDDEIEISDDDMIEENNIDEEDFENNE